MKVFARFRRISHSVLHILTAYFKIRNHSIKKECCYALESESLRCHGARGFAPFPPAERLPLGICVGGSICLLGEILNTLYCRAGFTLSDAAALTSATLIVLSGILTALGWYQKLASKAGAGTLVPITGFANSVVSPAIEFRSEGLVTGVGARMFIIAGPVIVYGMLASVAWGVIWHFIRPFF